MTDLTREVRADRAATEQLAQNFAVHLAHHKADERHAAEAKEEERAFTQIHTAELARQMMITAGVVSAIASGLVTLAIRLLHLG